MGFRRNKSGPALPAGPIGSGELVPRGGGVQGYRPPGPEPLPDAKPMPLGGPATRDACWARLPTAAAERLRAAAGESIEWWASLPSGWNTPGIGAAGDLWPKAVLFGREALCFAEPRVDSAHRPVHVIDRFSFDPASHRRAEVIFTPPRPARTGEDVTAGTAGAGLRRMGEASSAVPGLGPAALELVGNLPIRAQKLLTAGFDAEHPVLVCDWYYEGQANRFGVFAVVLAGAEQATLAHGSRVIPAGHDDASSHWSLTCRQARVRRRSSE